MNLCLSDDGKKLSRKISYIAGMDATLSMAESLIFGFVFAFAYRISAEDIEQEDQPDEEQIRLELFSRYN